MCIFPWIKILALCKTNLDDSIDSGNFRLTWKDSVHHMHGFAIYMKRGLLFKWELVSFCTVFDVISFNIEEVLSVNPSAKILVFGDVNVHDKDCLTYFSGTGRPGELCYNFFYLKQPYTYDFLIRSLTATLTVLLCLIYLFLLLLVFVLQ